MLNEKQQRFCLEYLIDYNATQAAIRAGYSPKTAGQQGFDLLKKLEIQEFIKMSSQKTFNKLEITRERVMQEIARLAFVDIRKLYDEEGRLLNIRSIDSDTAAAVCGLEVDELFEGTGQDRTQVGVTKKVKLSDKTKALEMLAKHFDLFNDAGSGINLNVTIGKSKDANS